MHIPEAIRKSVSQLENEEDINCRIEQFKIYLKDESHSIDNIVDRYLLFGTPYLFKDNEDIFFALKSEIADFLGIKQTQIYIVGSAKLGFSIAPKKRFKHFDEESDVDIAIIDSDLFLEYWKKLYRHMSDTSLMAISEEQDKSFKKFKDYFFKGWLRPDRFPMKYKQEWFDFFGTMTKKYDYHIAAGIYRDYDFFINYNTDNLNSLRDQLKRGFDHDAGK